MLKWMANYEAGPSAIRYPRGTINGSSLDAPVPPIELGKAVVVSEGVDVALIGLGTMFGMAEKTKAMLEERGLSVALVNPRFIKPLDGAVFERLAKQCRVVCTFEDHVLHNGFGCGVIELLSEAGIKTPVERIGWPDEFIEHGKPDILMKLHGLTPEAAVEKVMKHL
jgi:1-deoxy-D-xylulose-5-phosphate synthase